MKKITGFEVRGKRVLVRCDFNVPLDEKGEVIDDFRIEQVVPTIDYLIRNKARVILASHLGRPQGKVKPELSLAPVQEKLLEYLDCSVTKANDCLGPEIEGWTREMVEGEVLLLENLRFHTQEEANDIDFAKGLARLGDIFINEAFSVSHRQHASIVGLPQFLPSGIGLLFAQEITSLDKVIKNPARPLVGIVGGAKLESKIKSINGFLKRVNCLLVGGKIANALLAKKGQLPVKLEPTIGALAEKIDLRNPKLILPVDVLVVGKHGPSIRQLKEVREGDLVFDVGSKTMKIFAQKVKEAKTIFWVGPIGNVDEPGFEKGSLALAEAIASSKAFSLAGGGDTIAFLKRKGLADKLSYLSTGGGAMLEYLSKGTLVGIEALS